MRWKRVFKIIITLQFIKSKVSGTFLIMLLAQLWEYEDHLKVMKVQLISMGIITNCIDRSQSV